MRRRRARNLTFAALIAALSVAPSTATALSGVRVIDGDTIDVAGERVRILNIDTPERGERARCDDERYRAEQASRALRAKVQSARDLRLERDGLDRYGRTLALVYLDGEDVGEEMIDEEYAVRWGSGRPDWCALK